MWYRSTSAPLDQGVDPPRVSAAPVDPCAGGAAGELVVRPAGTRRQAVGDVLLRRGHEGGAARGAAGQRGQCRSEPGEDVGPLIVGPAAAGQGPPPQRPPPPPAPGPPEQN